MSSLPDIVYGSADPKDHSPAVTYSGNLALARVFPCSIDIEISYVGNTTRHLNGYSATNVVPVGSETTNNDFGPYFGGNGTFRLPCIHGPAYFNDELGIFKDFKIGDAGKLQIRLQGFNFLNRRFDTYQQYDCSLFLGFSNINTVTDNVATGGIPSSQAGHRSLQLAAKYYF